MRHRKFLNFFILFTGIFFVGLMAGGGYLHGHIHSHPTQESHDQCFIQICQSQIPLTLGVFALSVVLARGYFIPEAGDIFIVPALRSLYLSRAPPVPSR